MQKWGWCGGSVVTRVIGNIAILLRAYNVLFDFNRNYTSILYRFRVIVHFLSKVTNFNPPHLHLSPPKGVIPFEFRRELWCQKNRVPELSCGIICVILRLAVLIQYLSVTDTHTHRQTDTRRRHVPRLVQRRAVKIEKVRYLINRLANFDEISHDGTYQSSRAYQLFKKFKLLTRIPSGIGSRLCR